MSRIFDEISDPKSLFHLTFDSIYDGIYIVDKDRKIIFWNHAAQEMTGYTAEEVKGHRCSENILNHIDENGILLCRSACPIIGVMRTGEPGSHKVYPKNKQGKRFPVETHISAVRDDDGTIVGAIEVFRDITHQEEYRILQEKFNSLIRKYVSNKTFSEIQTRIQSDQSANQPHLVELTVMYLDVVGFTKFSEHNEPNHVVQMLNDLFGVCEVITKECFGDIDKFIGDAIMAIFIDADDAIRSALKILNVGLPEMNRVRRENSEEEIAIRIGINSGIVVQGDIGTLDRKDLTVIGDTVNTAARIEKMSPVNNVMISEATLARASEENCRHFTYHGTMPIRGKLDPIKLFINSTIE